MPPVVGPAAHRIARYDTRDTTHPLAVVPLNSPSGAWRALFALCLVLAPAAFGQVITRVDIDNDSFNFWQAPNQRADREYTQGTRINVLWPTGNRVARRLLGGEDHCRASAAERDCVMASVALQQAIFTPNLDLRVRGVNERPFAGWLGAEIGVQRDRSESQNAFALVVGVTGPPSLAEPAQKAIHRMFRFRPPVGWDEQLGSELAVAATYHGAWNAVRVRHEPSGMRLMLAPTWSARLGTLATDASAGVQLVAGFQPPLPWQTAPNVRGDRWSLFVRAGATQAVVARNLFLDGSTFTSGSARVEHNIAVGETELGIGIRMPAGLVEWRVHSRGREYKLQPRAHAYSTFSFSVR
jgi:lipid A 3-O-deacylase